MVVDTKFEPAGINFDLAEHFLKSAREAHEKGDVQQCMAARKMVAVALNLTDAPPQDIKDKLERRQSRSGAEAA